MSRPRTPGVVMGILAAVLIVLIAGLAMTQRQPPPPSIAEFAPQAVDNITEAPSDQGGSGGTGPASGVGGSGATPTPPPPVVLPQARRCVGDPPRQIEDPQSPPCVPSWVGDNGGSTHKGVTRDEVRIALPIPNANPDREWAMLAQFFNRRFEFYGRHITFQPMQVGGNSGGKSRPETQHAHAVHADEGLRAFASMPYPDTGGSTVFYDELARRGLVSVQALVAREQEPHFASKHPYEWSYAPTLDRSSSNLGEWACRTLAGGTAKHAGGTELGKPRVFGIFVNSYDDGTQDLTSLKRTIKACGLDPVVADMHYNDSDDTADGRAAVTKLREAGVTTVLCMCHPWPLWTQVFPAASSQAWFPEWLVASTPFMDYDNQAQTLAVREQMMHSFGVSGFDKHVATSDLPVTWAMKEADPAYSWGSDAVAHEWGILRYKQLLVLASGIQLAGPTLNPRTFGDGLQKTIFPNPTTPERAGRVSFSGDHSMIDNYAEVWWGADQQSVWGGAPGAWCYVDDGARHTPQDWPRGERPVFQGSCY